MLSDQEQLINYRRLCELVIASNISRDIYTDYIHAISHNKSMNKKTLIMAVIAALGVGGAGTFAYQSHAQQLSDTSSLPVINQAVSPAVDNSSVGTDTAKETVDKTENSTATDTDNIQDENGAVDKPDTVGGTEQADKETNDDKGGTALQSGDKQEQGEGTAQDANEKEDAN